MASRLPKQTTAAESGWIETRAKQGRKLGENFFSFLFKENRGERNQCGSDGPKTDGTQGKRRRGFGKSRQKNSTHWPSERKGGRDSVNAATNRPGIVFDNFFGKE